jgi:hypothetical protein
VVIKSVEAHPRVENERNLLKRFSGHPYIRQLVDEVHDVINATIVLEHLDDHLLNATINKTLNRKELKFVLRCVLQGLATLHEAGYIHTGKTAHSSPRFGADCTQISSQTISLSITITLAKIVSQMSCLEILVEHLTSHPNTPRPEHRLGHPCGRVPRSSWKRHGTLLQISGPLGPW